MKQHLTLTNILMKEKLQWAILIVILFGQSYLMWKINQKDDLPMLEAAQRISEQNDSIIKQNEVIISGTDSEIGSHVDTLKVINNYKTVLRESYNKDIAALVANDSSQRAIQYRDDFSVSINLFKEGFYFNK